MNRINHHGKKQARERAVTRSISVGLTALLVAMAVLSGVVAGVPTRALAQETAPVTASVTPDSSLMYFAVDLDFESAQYQKTSELLNRLGVDSVASLVSEMSTAATGEDVVGGIDPTTLLGGEAGLAVFDFGADFADMADAASGAMAGGMDAEPGAVPQPSLAAMFSAPDPAAAFAAAEQSLEEDATNRGATITDETYEGVTIRVVPGDEMTGTTGTALALVGDYVVIGMMASDVHKVIDTEAGRTPALAESADYQAVLAELNSDWLVNGYVNGDAMAALLTADPAAAASLGNLDLAQLNAQSGFVVWADDPGFRLDSIAISEGEMANPVAENFVAELPGMIPSDALVFADGYDLGASGILDTIAIAALAGLTGSVGAEMATPEAFQSPQEMAAEQFAQLEAILGFNLKTDFIDQMVGEWGLAAWGLNADAAAMLDPTAIKFILVSNTATAATVSDALSKLSLLIQAGLSGQGTVTTRVIGEDQVSVLTVDDGSTTMPIVIEYGIVNDRFVISYNGAVDELITDGGDSLADSASYQAAMAALPTERNGEFFIDLAQIVPIAEGFAAMTASTSDFEIADADEACAEYSTQAAAQEALDADPSANWELDQDFDGQACEDYYTDVTEAAATPEATTSPQLDALTAFASVSYRDGNTVGASAILLISAE